MARRKAKPTRIAFDGDVTIRSIDAAHAALRDAVGQVTSGVVLEVDCGQVEAADLGFIQLLLAARRSAAERGGTVTLAHPASDALHDALRRGGFLADQATDRDFWLPDTTGFKGATA